MTIFSINFISALIGNEIGTMAFESSLTNNYEYHLNTNTSKIISTIVKNIPPTTNCHTNHFHPVSDKAHFRIGDFLAKLYKYFFII